MTQWDDANDDPLESDMDFAEDSVDLEECPFCHKSIYAQADVCPRCGNFVSHEDFRAPRRPRWIVYTALVLLAVTLGGLIWALVRRRW